MGGKSPWLLGIGPGLGRTMKDITAIPKRFGSAGHSYDLDEDAWLTREGLEGTPPELRSAWEAYAPAWKADLAERLFSEEQPKTPLVDWEADLPKPLASELAWLRDTRWRFDVRTYNSDTKTEFEDPADYGKLMRFREWLSRRSAFSMGANPFEARVERFGPPLELVFWMVVKDGVSPERVAHWLFTTTDHVVGAVRYGLARAAWLTMRRERYELLQAQPSEV